ncbi:MAG TPA: PBP1A family penicillin-binding protein [Roseiflexaceae bacterium]|nr:PBP1A family penicillin-binding protein [Roseiflexaceae bacterium]
MLYAFIMIRTPIDRFSDTQRYGLAMLAFLWRLFLAFVKLTLLAAELVMLAALLVYTFYLQDVFAGLPDASAIDRRPAETTRIYARDGQTLLFELVDPQGGRRIIVPFNQIPQTLKNATIAVEDANFYQNAGVDLRGIVRALLQNYQAQEVVSGASTITQQLVRNVLLSPEERTSISFERKLREAYLAYRVSNEIPKDDILGMYLNQVYYGNQAYGVEAAAQAYFGKSAIELNDAEATLLAGLPQSPTVLNPLSNLEGAKARQRVTLDLMVKFGYLSAAQASAIYETPIQFAPQTASAVAPHFVNYVRDLLEQRYGPDLLYKGGLKVVTSLDPYWQAEAQRVVQQRIAALRPRDASNAAVVMLSPHNEVLAMVGSANFNDPSIDGQVNVAIAPRQPGSALKPIVYAAAMQRGWTPATVIWDVPTDFKLADGQVYRPQNYDDSWHGPQSVRMALSNSLNIPAVKAIQFAGVDNFVNLAHAMGITTLNDPAQYGLALALGAGEVKLLDLTNVYSTFANGGRARAPVSILRVTNGRGEILEQATPNDGKQALGAHGQQLAYLITSILSDNIARQYMFGPGNVMELPDRPAAVKTGTSNDWRDSWALGYTPDITVGVWVGNSDNSPMQEIAGVNGAGVIWRDIMNVYNQDRPVREFTPPDGIVEASVCKDTGVVADAGCPNQVKEDFIAGTEPKNSDVQVVTLKVGGDGACLAASYTPKDQVREKRFVIYPPEYQNWAASTGQPQPPTERCPPPPPTADTALARIAEPTANATITTTQTLVRGMARGSYTLEFGAGAEPTTWQPITQGTDSDGLLGIWPTADLPPGVYTLRLSVTSPEGVPIEARQQVNVTHGTG